MSRRDWRDALDLLVEMGWGSDKIELACETLIDACEGSEFDAKDPLELKPGHVERIVGDELEAEEGRAFQLLARTLAVDDTAARELRYVLWELDDA